MKKKNDLYNDNSFDDIDEVLKDDGIDEEIEEAYEKDNNKVRYIIMGVAVLIFIVCLVMLFNIFWNYRKGEKEYEDIDAQVFGISSDVSATKGADANKTTGNNSATRADGQTVAKEAIQELGPFTYNHEALKNINSDGVGYIYIPSIAVRLPVAQTDNNDFYLDHTFNKNYNTTGALFIEAGVNGGLSGSNVIIYGHNMKNGSMFAKLENYKHESFYKNSGNDIFYIYTENKVIEYRIFTAYECAPDSDTYTFNFNTAKGLQAYAQGMKEASLYDTGVDVSNAKQVVTLSTCTADGKRRIVVQGLYVTEVEQ